MGKEREGNRVPNYLCNALVFEDFDNGSEPADTFERSHIARSVDEGAEKGIEDDEGEGCGS